MPEFTKPTSYHKAFAKWAVAELSEAAGVGPQSKRDFLLGLVAACEWRNAFNNSEDNPTPAPVIKRKPVAQADDDFDDFDDQPESPRRKPAAKAQQRKRAEPESDDGFDDFDDDTEDLDDSDDDDFDDDDDSMIL